MSSVDSNGSPSAGEAKSASVSAVEEKTSSEATHAGAPSEHIENMDPVLYTAATHKRVIASLINLALSGVVLYMTGVYPSEFVSWTQLLVCFSILIVIPTAFLALKGATLGHYLLGLQVVTLEDVYLEKLPLKIALQREFTSAAFTPLQFFSVGGMFFRADRRTWVDVITKTQVIQIDAPLSEVRPNSVLGYGVIAAGAALSLQLISALDPSKFFTSDGITLNANWEKAVAVKPNPPGQTGQKPSSTQTNALWSPGYLDQIAPPVQVKSDTAMLQNLMKQLKDASEGRMPAAVSGSVPAAVPATAPAAVSAARRNPAPPPVSPVAPVRSGQNPPRPLRQPARSPQSVQNMNRIAPAARMAPQKTSPRLQQNVKPKLRR